MTNFISQFHFLRPEYLSLLLMLPLLYWLGLKGISSADHWAKVMPAHLLKVLRPAQSRQKSKRTAAAPCLLLVLASFALAGPAWQQKHVPVAQIQDDMVVILDLSISMLANDQRPNRLTRAKQKLQDLLALRKEGSTALIVFSGDAHVVTPLSDDVNTILSNMAALAPFTLPVIGSRPDLAINQALALFEGAKSTKGRIVMLSDGVNEKQAQLIKSQLSGSNFTLNIISVGTKLGAPIDLGERGYLKHKGEVVIPKTDHRALQALANSTDGRHSELSLNDDDLNALRITATSTALNTLEADAGSKQSQRQFDQWHDMGVYLLPLIIALALMFKRQNMLWALLLLVLPSLTPLATPTALAQVQAQTASEGPADAKSVNNAHQDTPTFGWQDLWQTRDQQAQALAQQGQYSEAASLFKSDEHRAHAHFKAQEYAEAIAHYQQAQRQYQGSAKADLLTDKANAQALMSDFDGALNTLEQALKAAPDNARAKRSQALIEALKEQQQKQEQQQQEQQEQQQEQQQNQQGQGQDQNSEQKQNAHDQDSQNSEQQQSNEGDQGEQQNQSQQAQQDQAQQPQDQQQNGQAQNDQDQNEQDQAPASTEQSQTDANNALNQSAADEEAEPAALAEKLSEQPPLSSEEQQAFEQWMNRVPDDPSELLKRKFQQQARQRNRTSQDPGDPLW